MDLGSVDQNVTSKISKDRFCIVYDVFFKILELKSIFEVFQSSKKVSNSDPFQITSEKRIKILFR